MNQVNLAVADIRYQKPEAAAGTKDVKNDKDAFKTYLEERYETKDVSDQPTDKKETDVVTDENGQTDVSEEAALLLLQMGQMLPDSLGIKVMPEGLTQAVPTVLPTDGEVSLEVPVMNPENAAQPEAGAQGEGEGLFVEKESLFTGKEQEAGMALDGMELTDTAETVDVKLPETQNAAPEEKTSEGLVSEEQPEITKEVGAVSQTLQSTEELPAGQTVVTDAPRDTNVQESRVTERIHVSKPEELPQKLTEELMAKVSKGVKEFEIQIEPRNLGKIAIKVLYEQGQTVISILCSEKRTLELIGHNAREIGYMMEQNLGDTTTIYVDKQETDYLYHDGESQDHTGRDSEQDRQREENRKNQTDDSGQFIQKLRLGLTE